MLMKKIHASAPVLFALVVSVGATLAGIGGCSLSATDRRVNRLLGHYTTRLDGGAISPSRTFPPAKEERSDSQLDEKPGTVNPPVEALPFDPAAPDRDVSARLDSYAEPGIAGTVIDLPEAFRIAQKTAREYLTAEEEYILAAIRLLVEQHRFSPRFFDDVSASANGSVDTTNFDTAIRIVNELRATQQLPYGGNVEAKLIWNATDVLRENVAQNYSSATSLVLDANIPLLRGAGPIAKESLIQAERDLVYAARGFERFRRQFLVDIARDYFSLVAQQSAIVNQQRSYNSLLQSQKRTEARVEAGRLAAFETRRFENNVLSARNRLINARERFILSKDRFKVRLGLPIEKEIAIVPTKLDIPEPDISPQKAAEMALEYRLDLQTQRDRVDDGRRGVANSKNQLLPDLNLTAGLSVNSNASDKISNYNLDFNQTGYNASVTFGLPLDREIERLNLRSSMIGLGRDQRAYEQFRDNVIVSARAAVRAVDQSRFSLGLAERQVEINRLLLEQLKIEEASSLEITTGEQDLLDAEDTRDNSIRDLRISILDYLLATGLMRVAHDGQFEPLPGMGEILMEREAPPTAEPVKP